MAGARLHDLLLRNGRANPLGKIRTAHSLVPAQKLQENAAPAVREGITIAPGLWLIDGRLHFLLGKRLSVANAEDDYRLTACS
jgi:hypothetical protein